MFLLVSWLHFWKTNLCCANGRCRLNVIEVCSPETVIMLNIQNEDCFISKVEEKRFRSVRQASPMTIVPLHKAGVWTAKEIQLLDTLPPYQLWSLYSILVQTFIIDTPCQILELKG